MATGRTWVVVQVMGTETPGFHILVPPPTFWKVLLAPSAALILSFPFINANAGSSLAYKWGAFQMSICVLFQSPIDIGRVQVCSRYYQAVGLRENKTLPLPQAAYPQEKDR